jgi:chorismate mutase
VTANDPVQISDGTERVLGEMLERNAVGPQDVVSIIFTVTPDLDAEFPAVAARRLDLAHVPLLCTSEIPVPGALPRCIRVLMHMYTERDYASLRHVYLEEASRLRTDLLD